MALPLNDWQMPKRFGLNNLIQPGQAPHQYITIEEQKRRQCLILRECKHLTFNGQLDEKATDLRSPHLARVPMMVKAQKAPSSVDVLLLGARARHVWLVASGATHLANVARQSYLAAYLQTLAMPMACKEMTNAHIMHDYTYR